ncbi:MAG TPA: PD-(D/E)XK nuclease family protein, partial [Salinimicrobium sp.]|nr:PD-(D/E)XK nuclease family protein [Salinimicrobium sp.]
MTPFITQILQELLQRKRTISDYVFVLPSKRAGSFLVNQLSNLATAPVFAPKIYSIEDFASEISGLKAVDNTAALFEFYSVYLKLTPKEKTENFETFSSWAQTLLYDFNEIDRYLIDHKSFFGYLSEIQEMNHWYLQPERTPLMENYISFWRKLPEYYEHLKGELLHRNLGYQGMVYRQASEKVEEYLQKNDQPHVFLGFNALNNAEQHIIQAMLESGTAEIFWDIDEVFLNDSKHEASLFIRRYLKKWPFYAEIKPEKISKDFSSEKKIRIAGIPKNIGQAKYLGELLAGFSPNQLSETAVVLGDESLLLPVLNSLPPNIQEINVTMGFPLKNAPVTALFEQLLEMHARFDQSWFYKDIIAVIDHPLIQKITGRASKILSEKIHRENLIYLSPKALSDLFPEFKNAIFNICFSNWENSPALALENLQNLLLKLKQALDKEEDKLSLEFLYQFHLLFNKLNNLAKDYPHLATIKSLYSIFKDLLNSQTVDFRGQPFQGLQIMGMLESRVLDFKNVIITSVNEGVLPAGKSSNSFIPFDLKCAYKLPTYKEKDAVYTYHFYHLLQRSQQIHILYNTESDGLNGGEKSRFLLQLEMEKKPAHQISNFTVASRVPAISLPLKTIRKNPEIMQKLKERASKGFSPSALTTYIRNPLDFYHQYILGIREPEEMEETIAYNTLGTVVHQSLETFY